MSLNPKDKVLLFKLHELWPDRQQFAGTPAEAILFYKWLLREYPRVRTVRSIRRVSVLQDFLDEHRFILMPVQTQNQRGEARVESQVGILLKVLECDSDDSWIGVTSPGQTIDLCPHGLGVRAESRLPTDAKFEITLAPKGFPIRIYSLVGETKWEREDDKGLLLGLQLSETGDFDRWLSEFPSRFGRQSAMPEEPKESVAG